MATATKDLADAVIATLRRHEQELRAAGIRRLSVSAPSHAAAMRRESDVDLAAELDLGARIGLFGLGSLECRLTDLLGRTVDLVPEPVEKQRLQVNIDRDRRMVL